jgi:hypothetical protein
MLQVGQVIGSDDFKAGQGFAYLKLGLRPNAFDAEMTEVCDGVIDQDGSCWVLSEMAIEAIEACVSLTRHSWYYLRTICFL